MRNNEVMLELLDIRLFIFKSSNIFFNNNDYNFQEIIREIDRFFQNVKFNILYPKKFAIPYLIICLMYIIY